MRWDEGFLALSIVTVLPMAGCGARGAAVEGAAAPTENAAAPQQPPSDEAGPPGDADGDGIVGEADLCPGAAEDRDNFEDGNGCPDPDNDLDNLPDGADDCPNEPETYNGKDDEDGCPDDLDVFADVGPDIDIPDALYYKSGKEMVSKDWLPVLDVIAKLLIGHPEILKVEIGAHTDAQGTEAHNLGVSRQIAAAVFDYLVQKGVDPKVLSAAGYGEACPRNLGAVKKSFSKNKRVEFKILETKNGCTAVPFACQKAIDQKLVPDEELKYLPGGDYCK
jgi:OOP family OmpA-OmpF porin